MKSSSSEPRLDFSSRLIDHVLVQLLLRGSRAAQLLSASIESHVARGPSARPFGPARSRHGPMDQAVSGPPPWPVARPGHGTVVQAGTVTARCPIWPSSPRRPATANISAAQEVRSPARLPPIPHSLPASPIPNPNPHSLSLARSLSLCSRSRSTAATAIGPVLGSGDLAGAPPLHLANPVRLSPSPPSFPSPLALGET